MDAYFIAQSFVKNALALATNCPSAEFFNESWYKDVSRETGLSEEEARLLHHPFWWYLTSDTGVLAYIQNTGRGEKARVGFNCSGKMQRISVRDLTEAVLKEHGDLLREKIRKHISTPLQAA